MTYQVINLPDGKRLRVPLDEELHVNIFEDADPPRHLARYFLTHAWQDSPEITPLILAEEENPTPLRSPLGRIPFQMLPVLQEVCDANGMLKPHAGTGYKTDSSTRWHLSLAPWLKEKSDQRRAWIFHVGQQRYELSQTQES